MFDCSTTVFLCFHYQIPNRIFYIFSLLILIIICRRVLKHIKFIAPAITMTYTIGIIVGYYTVRKIEIQTDLLEMLLITSLIIQSSLKTDVSAIIRHWKQTLLVGIIYKILETCALLHSLSHFMATQIGWSYQTTHILSILLVANFPLMTFVDLADMGTISAPILFLLQTENLLGTVIQFTYFKIESLSQQHELETLIPTNDSSFKIVQYELIDIMMGLVFGKVVIFLMNMSRKYELHFISIHMLSPFIGFFITQTFLRTSGVWFLLFLGAYYNIQRKNIPPSVDRSIVQLWTIFLDIQRHLITFYMGALFSNLVLPYMEPYDAIIIICIYIITIVVRVSIWLILSPILIYMEFNLNFAKIIIASFSIYLSPICGVLVFTLFKHKNNYHIIRMMLMILSGLFYLHTFCTKIVYISILKFTKFNEYTNFMKSNMNRSMIYLATRRMEYVNILKTDRDFSDTNWKIVMEETAIKHPYHLRTDPENIDIDDGKIVCPECLTEIPRTFSKKEKLDSLRIIRRRLLIARKYYYIKNYRLGQVSASSQRFLLNLIQQASESQDKIIPLEKITKLYTLDYLTTGYLKQFSKFLLYDSLSEKPNNIVYQLCYYLIKLNILDVIVFFTSLYSMYFVINYGSWQMSNPLIYVYVVELIIIIMALITDDRNKETLFKIIKNKSVIINSLVILFVLFEWHIGDRYLINGQDNLNEHIVLKVSVGTLNFLKALNALRRIFCLNFSAFLKEWFRKRTKLVITSKAYNVFGLGRHFIESEQEILEFIHCSTMDVEIKEQLMAEFHHNIFTVIRCLVYIGRLRDWLVTTNQTKYALFGVLKEIEKAVIELKNAGWLGELENKKLAVIIHKYEKSVEKIKCIKCPLPNQVFYEIPWLSDDSRVNDFLYEHLKCFILHPGDVLVDTNQRVDGVYLVVTGLFKTTSSLDPVIRNRLSIRGELPVVDYLNYQLFTTMVDNYLCVGCTCGELSFLTKRKSNSKVIAEVYSQVLFIPGAALKEAFEKCADPLYGLEAKMWRAVTINYVKLILKREPFYQTLDKRRLNFLLENSFVPNVSQFQSLVLDSRVEDLVLIEGQCVNSTTKEMYTAPCYIPRNCRKISLAMAGSGDDDVQSEFTTPKFLFVIKKAVSEYDVMENMFENSLRLHQSEINLKTKYFTGTASKGRGFLYVKRESYRTAVFKDKRYDGLS